MSVPSRADAARLLLALEPPDYLVAHCSAVAEIAAFLAARTASRGRAIDVPLVEAAALLHDVDRALPADHPLKTLGHGHAGAAWLSDRGHGELAPAVAGHPVTRLSDDENYRRWRREATLEERVVAYADKRAMLELVPLGERFREWTERFPEHAESLRVTRGRAELLEQELCAAAGILPGDVTRFPWVESALRLGAA